MKHRWELYRETFNKGRIILLLSLIALLVIFHDAFISKEICFVKAVFNPLDEKATFTTLCVVALFMYASYKAFEKIYFFKDWPSLTSIAIFLSIGSYYWMCYRSDPTWIFFKLFSTDIYLTDLLLISLFLLTTDFIHLQPSIKEGSHSLFPDDPSKVENDLLGRDQYIEKVKDAIQDTVADRAIGISILAEWGFGKTVFMNLLEKRLKENPDTIIVHFNPWIGERSQSTIKYFFEALEDKLQKYDSSASRKISQYTKDLLQPVESDNLWTKLAKTGTSFMFPGETTIQEKKEAINKIIGRIGKRIVVLLDDLDRLNGEELSDVMRLIRNTADFKRTFFVAALDRNYVLNALKESNMLESRDRYLEKIFQLEIVLPPIQRNAVKYAILHVFGPIIQQEKIENFEAGRMQVSELEEIIKELWSDDDGFRQLQQILSEDQSLTIQAIITNLRDVQRFANSFQLTYRMINGEYNHEKGILREFFLLELIKFRAPNIYDLLAYHIVLEKNIEQEIWDVNEDKLSSILGVKSISSEKDLAHNDVQIVLKNIIKLIFMINSKEYDSRSVRVIENHPFYFNYSNVMVFDLLKSLNEGYGALKSSIDKLANKGNI